MALSLLTLLLLLLLTSTASVNSAYTSSHVRSIFILAGQSNMSGRGGIINGTWNGVVPLQCRPKPYKILRLSAALTWVDAREPLHRDIDVNTTCGVGPGMAFANSVLRRDPGLGVVGLVPCAVGSTMGTKISQWGRGTFLYKQMLHRARAAAGGDAAKIKAVLWFQGESDTTTPVEAKMYRIRWERMMGSLRADLKLPKLPIIQVALASGQGPYVDAVRRAQFGVQLPYVTTIDARGLPLSPDNLHLSAPAQVRLGAMFAKVFPVAAV